MTGPGLGTVYLLHFARKIGNLDNPRAQAQHYIGWAWNATERLAEHRSGHGASITAYAASVGVEFEIARTWDGDRHFERALKNRKNAKALCPTCRTAN